jgi:hypothetical protein
MKVFADDDTNDDNTDDYDEEEATDDGCQLMIFDTLPTSC